ncbi:hypothetical protein GGS23DRAFT_92420 [Durotheca rogersii]|uniref:uncharacterized protein n=1 Tax=Durotheca rogersii TaxID=419775 RepID=UPI00221E4470|nr:uncharacterized protein GGS23DRAFT_92420 [Durotheca rogersii]KAI5862311.1 hypothetical protein GGS23DRAFT_92420 [Durotheca rogersii]
MIYPTAYPDNFASTPLPTLLSFYSTYSHGREEGGGAVKHVCLARPPTRILLLWLFLIVPRLLFSNRLLLRTARRTCVYRLGCVEWLGCLAWLALHIVPVHVPTTVTYYTWYAQENRQPNMCVLAQMRKPIRYTRLYILPTCDCSTTVVSSIPHQYNTTHSYSTTLC